MHLQFAHRAPAKTFNPELAEAAGNTYSYATNITV